ncbi:CPBP family intramembrane metalloprotease [Omnitrophica bacterium]|nr:CPBP family intramembrane metalloprotease [Candidatus Omnitrophota bacterium]
MIRRIWNFFFSQRIYTLLFLVLVALWVHAWLAAPEPEYSEPQAQGQPASAFEKFRKIEDQFRDRVGAAESFEAYMKENPEVARTYLTTLAVVLGLFSSGVIVILLWVFTPALRRAMIRPEIPAHVRWSPAMLFQVVVLFLVLNFPLGFLIDFLENILFPRVSSNLFTLIHTTLADALCLALIVWSVTRRGGRWRDLGIPTSWKQAAKDVLTAWGGYLAVVPLFLLSLIGVLVISQLMAYEPQPHPLVNIFLEEETRAPLVIWYSIALACLIGPIIEEFFFRGFCYPILKNRLGRGWGMVLTSGAFAVIHMNQFSFVPIFILGMGLVAMYEIRKSLVAPAILHVTHNTLFIIYFFVMKDLVVRFGVGT